MNDEKAKKEIELGMDYSGKMLARGLAVLERASELAGAGKQATASKHLKTAMMPFLLADGVLSFKSKNLILKLKSHGFRSTEPFLECRNKLGDLHRKYRAVSEQADEAADETGQRLAEAINQLKDEAQSLHEATPEIKAAMLSEIDRQKAAAA